MGNSGVRPPRRASRADLRVGGSQLSSPRPRSETLSVRHVAHLVSTHWPGFCPNSGQPLDFRGIHGVGQYVYGLPLWLGRSRSSRLRVLTEGSAGETGVATLPT